MKVSIQKNDLRNSDLIGQFHAEIMRNVELADASDAEAFSIQMLILLQELFTNACKHITGQMATFHLSVTNDLLVLSLEMEGQGFIIKPFGSSGSAKVILFPSGYSPDLGTEFTLHRDDEFIVQCTIWDNSTLIFKSVKQHSDAIQIADFPEHFGLAIFTQLCDSVTYHRSAEKTDIFILKKKIR